MKDLGGIYFGFGFLWICGVVFLHKWRDDKLKKYMDEQTEHFKRINKLVDEQHNKRMNELKESHNKRMNELNELHNKI